MADELENGVRPRNPSDVLWRELHAGLNEAMRNRNLVAIEALRSALSAIDNAGAADAAQAAETDGRQRRFRRHRLSGQAGRRAA